MTAQEIFAYFENDDTIISGIVFERIITLDFEKHKEANLSFFSMEFENCHFKKRFFIRNLKDDLFEVRFTNCKLDFELRGGFTNLELSLLEFNNCSFNSLFLNNVVSDEIKFIECESLKVIQIESCKSEDIEISNNQEPFSGEFSIKSPDSDVYIEAKMGIERISIDAIDSASIEGNINEFVLTAKKFGKIEMEYYFESDELLPTKIQKFDFMNSNFEGDLVLQNIYINQLNFDSLLSNNGSIRMNEVNLENSSFKDCTISNFYWNQVKFINDPEIISCDLSNLKMSNVYWKSGRRLKDTFLDEDIPWFYGMRLKFLKKRDEQYSEDEISILKYQRDTYRQLKVASIASHNQIEALAFYKNEMNLYWKEIRIEGGELWYDRILIFLGRFVSNFGQNWALPLIWLFVSHFIFMMCVFNWSCSFAILHMNINFGFFGEFFQMLNPIHKLPDYINTDEGKITDFFMRVIGGYFIYHFIKASRKFSEK